MREKGLNYVCDRCKYVHFMPIRGCASGITDIESMGYLPDGWGYKEEKHLCPVCFDEYKALIKSYFEEEKVK